MMSREIFSAPMMRQLLRRARICTLSTLDREDGTPYGSLANLMTGVCGEPVLLLSRLAWHTQNLIKDGRASVLVTSLPQSGDALTGERVTVLGHFTETNDPALRQRYLAQHPEAAAYIDFADFSLWQMIPHKVHGVAGFGRIDSYPAAEVFPDASDLSTAESSVLTHMNEDHAETIQIYAAQLSPVSHDNNSAHPIEVQAWRMTSIDCDGATLSRNDEHVRLTFPQIVLTPHALRQMFMRLKLGGLEEN